MKSKKERTIKMARVRNVHGGTEKYTQIFTADRMDRKCHAYHQYEIFIGPGNDSVAEIKFQQGPIKEVGANGCSNEDLLAIVADRLRCFQEGKFRCPENENALDHIETALVNLNARTRNREQRGVEGQNKA